MRLFAEKRNPGTSRRKQELSPCDSLFKCWRDSCGYTRTRTKESLLQGHSASGAGTGPQSGLVSRVLPEGNRSRGQGCLSHTSNWS